MSSTAIQPIARPVPTEAACKPVRYCLLVRLPEQTTKTAGGLYMPDANAQREHTGSIIAQVVALGPDAYRDDKRFPSGPACCLGDWVMFRRYAGTRFKIDGAEHRLLNDDSIEAVVDPERIEAI